MGITSTIRSANGPPLLRKEARGGGKAATSYCFVSFRHDQRALQSPFGNLRPLLIGLYRTQRWQVAAALSAAVTTTPKQETAPNSHGRASPKERTSLFPATLRERGSGGEALLLEKRPLPQNLPPKTSFREGARGRGLFYRKAPSLAITHNSLIDTSACATSWP